jgi:cell wall-active antibiotic response 4TMS protein YvqF
MRVNRRFLYWGIFLVAIGSVLVIANVSGLDSRPIADALRLWPLVIVAIGVGIVVRRTRFSVAGGILAAVVLGLFIGDGFALASRFASDCGVDGAPSTGAPQEGGFDGPARISMTTACGSLVVTSAPGSTWRFDAGNTTGRPPIVDSSARSLSIDGGESVGWGRNGSGPDAWRLTLPTTAIEDLSFDVNAGEGRIGLPGAQIGHLDVTTNAARTTVDLSEASVASVSGSVNAGMLSLRLSATADLSGSMEVNAGSLEICAPSELGLRVHRTGALAGISINGKHQTGADWESLNYTSATHHAELTLDINLGNVKINPTGGCK